MIALALLAAPATAYQWDFDEAPIGDEMTIHLCLGSFTPAQVTQIFQGADAWQAGDGQVLRGARWTYTRGPDRAEGSCGPDNGYNEVHAQDDGWFADHDAAGVLATTMNDDVSRSSEVDFVWNTLREPDWSARKPSKTPDGDRSLGMIALHEFGHGLGFNHDNSWIAVMNSSYPNGGDLGGKYRPHSDDYAGIADQRPHTSEGTNFLLGKHVVEPNDPGDSIEAWNVATDAWTVCRDTLDGGDGPEAIYAAVHDTGGPRTVDVAWRLSDDPHCFHGAEHEVAREAIELGVGAPLLLQPATWDFSAVPAGDYHLCAKIDPGNSFAEVQEDDNRVRSEALVTVEDCP